MDAESRAHTVDVALVVVHGIGQQSPRHTLYSWAEPLAAELDALLRSRFGSGLRVESVDDDPQSGGRIVLSSISGTPPRRIAISEARWADSFLSISNSEVVRWTLGFAPRAVGRALRHAWRSAAVSIEAGREASDHGWSMLRNAVRIDESGHEQPGPISWQIGTAAVVILSGVAIAVGVVAAAAIIAAILPIVLLAVAAALISLLVASYLPVIGPRVRPILLAINSSVGDASIWTSRPIRAAAMRDTVRGEIRRARALADCVLLLGHSQGAPVCVAACLGDDREPVDVLLTVGGAVDLLGVSGFSGLSTPSVHAVDQWADEPDMRWINAWATWDLVPSGPVAINAAASRRRWAATRRRAAALRDLREMESALPPPPRTGGLLGFALDVFNLQPKEDRVPGQLYISWGDKLLLEGAGEATVDPELARKEIAEALVAEARRKQDLTQILGGPPRDQGPEEWPLHNKASLITDHVTYTSNRDQLLSRLALLLLEPAHQFVATRLPENGTEAYEQQERERRHTSRIRSLAVYRLVCLPVGALVVAALLRPWITVALEEMTERSNRLKGIWSWAWTITLSGEIRSLVLFALATISLALILTWSAKAQSSRWSLSHRKPWWVATWFAPGAFLAGFSVLSLWNSPVWGLLAFALALVVPIVGYSSSPFAAISQSLSSGRTVDERVH